MITKVYKSSPNQHLPGPYNFTDKVTYSQKQVCKEMHVLNKMNTMNPSSRLKTRFTSNSEGPVSLHPTMFLAFLYHTSAYTYTTLLFRFAGFCPLHNYKVRILFGGAIIDLWASSMFTWIPVVHPFLLL